MPDHEGAFGEGSFDPSRSVRQRLLRFLLGSLTCLLAVLPLPTTASAAGERLWFTEPEANKVGAITTAGQITEYSLPAGTDPSAIAASGASLWFTQFGSGKVAQFSTRGFLQAEFATGSGPSGIVFGPDGALWFTETNANRIGRLTTGGSLTEFQQGLTSGSEPGGIVSGPDGALWFTEFTGNNIGRIDTSGQITEYPIPTSASQPGGIASGPDGALWFTQENGNKIGRITTGGQITNEFPTPTQPSGPLEIVTGPDGALWFTEFGANPAKIGRITTGGQITEYPLPTGFRPGDIVVGPSEGGSLLPPPPPPAPNVTASVLSLRVSPKAFRAAPRGSSISAKAKVGAKVTYRLSASASTRFTVERETVGRKKGKRCVKPTRRNRRAKRCKLYKTVRGSFSRSGKAGSNNFRFTGRLNRKKLRPGRYRLVAKVGTSKSAKRANFRIVRR